AGDPADRRYRSSVTAPADTATRRRTGGPPSRSMPGCPRAAVPGSAVRSSRGGSGRRRTARTSVRRGRARLLSRARPAGDQGGGVAVQATEVIVRRAGALRGHHAGADRRLRGTRGAEHLALPRLEHTLEHLTALAGLRVGDPHPGDREALFGVELGELVA